MPGTTPLTSADPNANRQPITDRHVHRDIQRHGDNIASGRLQDAVERLVERCTWRRSVLWSSRSLSAQLRHDAGPAHAVYFASYETVKHALGGNEGGNDEHHPFAAGA